MKDKLFLWQSCISLFFIRLGLTLMPEGRYKTELLEVMTALTIKVRTALALAQDSSREYAKAEQVQWYKKEDKQ